MERRVRMAAAALLQAALLLAGLPATARAQQATADMGINRFPAGITVIATADVPVASWLERASFTSPQGLGEARRFADALTAAGVSSQEVTIVPSAAGSLFAGSGTTVTVTTPPDVYSHVLQIARARRLKASPVQMVPANAQDLYDRALVEAIANSRTSAQAIAGADHQHVGRLLNFMPSPADFARQLAQSTIAGQFFTSVNDGTVTASGLATFALVP